MREQIDPNNIEDEALRQVVIGLMNLVEELSTKVAKQAEEIQRLRDENHRLKGEQGKPKIKANKIQGNISSEKERREPRGHAKGSKQPHLHIDRVEEIKLDRHHLPSDVVLKGYEEVTVQELVFRAETILFRKEKYYSPGEQRTYQARLPAGYHGQFGPQLRAWVLTLYYQGVMSEPKILEILETVGITMSAGQLSDLLIKDQERFHAERTAIMEAGLASSPWHHLDSTGTRVNGRNEYCHLLCNPLYTAYWTLPANDRMSLLQVLQGGAEPVFAWNELAGALLCQLGVSEKWCRLLPSLLSAKPCYSQEQLDGLLDQHLPKLGMTLRKRVKEALAIANYRRQSTYPVVRLLVCDDAPQFNSLTAQLALCWVHEFRHYKQLMPRFLAHCALFEQFAKEFWQFYRDLLAYRDHPSEQQAEALSARFDQLFGPPSGYEQLDARRALTRAKKDALLMVLAHPEIFLHNNPAQLGARQRVRKRDVSLQARTREGIAAWDTFQTIVATAKKLGVNVFQYLLDRIRETNPLTSLASLIAQRAADGHLAVSWASGP